MASESSKNLVLYRVLGVVAFLAASYWVWALVSGADEIPDTPESRTAWICQKCGHIVELTSKEQFELEQKASKWTRSTEGKQVISARQLTLPCPACNDGALQPAGKCASCQKIYDPLTAPPGLLCDECTTKGLKPRSELEPPEE